MRAVGGWRGGEWGRNGPGTSGPVPRAPRTRAARCSPGSTTRPSGACALQRAFRARGQRGLRRQTCCTHATTTLCIRFGFDMNYYRGLLLWRFVLQVSIQRVLSAKYSLLTISKPNQRVNYLITSKIHTVYWTYRYEVLINRFARSESRQMHRVLVFLYYEVNINDSPSTYQASAQARSTGNTGRSSRYVSSFYTSWEKEYIEDQNKTQVKCTRWGTYAFDDDRLAVVGYFANYWISSENEHFLLEEYIQIVKSLCIVRVRQLGIRILVLIMHAY